MMLDQISGFRIIRIVSEGAHEALLEAVSQTSDEHVAIQVMRGVASTEELDHRWRRAVAVSRLLAHPAVVRCFHAGRLPDGSVYRIQEQLSGETLAARLAARRRLPVTELLRIGCQSASVLSEAHARGFVHRALRPESLQLVPDPDSAGGEKVKLNDWGLAVVPVGDAQLADLPPVPLAGPTYLAPEQCPVGTSADPDDNEPRLGDISGESTGERIDVYALGVMLFELASGCPPFFSRLPSELIAMHIAEIPPRLEPRSLGIPGGLSALIAAMLLKDPKARPTMREVEQRFERLIAEQQLLLPTTPAPPDVTLPSAQVWPSTNPTVKLPSPSVRTKSLSPSPGILALAFMLPLTIVLASWWLYAPRYSASKLPKSIRALPAGESAAVVEERSRPVANQSVAATAWVAHAAAPGAEHPQIRYPPLRDGLQPPARMLSRLRYPPLRDGNAVAVLRGKRRWR